MIVRDKMFIVADNVDESIKSQLTVHEVTLFKTFVDFEAYVNEVPTIIESLIVTTDTLPFTGTNMSRLMNALQSPFFKITGNVIYLIDRSYKLESVQLFLQENGLEWVVYQDDMTVKFVTDIATGDARKSIENQKEVVTYRIRASEYVKLQNEEKYQSEEGKYYTDEEILGDIPDEEEPEDIQPSQQHIAITNYIVGDYCKERTLMVFLLAQYFALDRKTLVLEKDIDYHMLTEMVTKSDVEHEFIDIQELYTDSLSTIGRIQNSPHNLIIVGSKRRTKYDYEFIFEILKSNLKDCIYHFIKECAFDEVPYGKCYTIVTPNTIPDVLRCCQSLQYAIDEKDVTFVGVQVGTYGPVNISTDEMDSIITQVLMKNGIGVQVVRLRGIELKGDNVAHDILGILNRGNEG